MELRGIAGVVASDDIKPGLFHLQSDPDGGTWLCLRVGQSGGHHQPKIWDIVFDRLDRHGIFYSDPFDIQPGVTLPPISVRIDHTSLVGTQFSTNFRAPMIAVAGKEAFAKTPVDRHGSLTFNLATGEVASPPTGWVCFSRWSLIIDRGDDEIALFSCNANGS